MTPILHDEVDERPLPAKAGGLAKCDILPILALVLIGLLLRVSKLSSQSFWEDEYYLTCSLHMPSLSTCLRYMSFIAPDNVPLGYAAVYVWGQLVGADSWICVRLLSVILGIACIPILYALVSSLYGRPSAIVAALCLALSPFHIDIAQGPRPNLLIEVLALTSICSFVGILRCNTRGAWVINAISNCLLVWTHVLNLLLLAVEGLFLLCVVRARPWRTALWIVALFASVTSAYFWIASVRSTIPDEQDDFYMRVPAIRALAADFLADDAVMTTDPFCFQGQTWGFLPEGMQRAVVEAHTQVDTGMMLFFGTCLAGFAWQTFVQFRKSWRDQKRKSETANALSSAFLLGIVFLPLLMLIVLAFVYRPAMLPRYTSYSSFACYAATGAVLSRIRQKPQRLTAYATLLVLYAYQLSVALPATTRANWFAVGNLIKADLRPNDLVLVKGTHFAWELFRFNCRLEKATVLPAYTLEAMSLKSARFLEKNAGMDMAAAPSVWAVIEPFTYTLPPLRTFEESLMHRGLRFTRTDFKGMNGLYVYRIARSNTGAPRESAEPIRANVDCAAILSDLGYARDDTEALSTLRWMIDAEFPRTRFYYTILAMECLTENCLDMGAAAVERALALDPNYPVAYEMLAVISGARGDAAGALAAYKEAAAKDRSGFLSEYRVLFDALYAKRDSEAAAEECRRLDGLGYYVPFALRLGAGTAEQPAYLTACGAAAP